METFETFIKISKKFEKLLSIYLFFQPHKKQSIKFKIRNLPLISLHYEILREIKEQNILEMYYFFEIDHKRYDITQLILWIYNLSASLFENEPHLWREIFHQFFTRFKHKNILLLDMIKKYDIENNEKFTKQIEKPLFDDLIILVESLNLKLFSETEATLFPDNQRFLSSLNLISSNLTHIELKKKYPSKDYYKIYELLYKQIISLDQIGNNDLRNIWKLWNNPNPNEDLSLTLYKGSFFPIQYINDPTIFSILRDGIYEWNGERSPRAINLGKVLRINNDQSSIHYHALESCKDFFFAIPYGIQKSDKNKYFNNLSQFYEKMKGKKVYNDILNVLKAIPRVYSIGGVNGLINVELSGTTQFRIMVRAFIFNKNNLKVWAKALSKDLFKRNKNLQSLCHFHFKKSYSINDDDEYSECLEVLRRLRTDFDLIFNSYPYHPYLFNIFDEYLLFNSINKGIDNGMIYFQKIFKDKPNLTPELFFTNAKDSLNLSKTAMVEFLEVIRENIHDIIEKGHFMYLIALFEKYFYIKGLLSEGIGFDWGGFSEFLFDVLEYHDFYEEGMEDKTITYIYGDVFRQDKGSRYYDLSPNIPLTHGLYIFCEYVKKDKKLTITKLNSVSFNVFEIELINRIKDGIEKGDLHYPYDIEKGDPLMSSITISPLTQLESERFTEFLFGRSNQMKDSNAEIHFEDFTRLNNLKQLYYPYISSYEINNFYENLMAVLDNQQKLELRKIILGVSSAPYEIEPKDLKQMEKYLKQLKEIIPPLVVQILLKKTPIILGLERLWDNYLNIKQRKIFISSMFGQIYGDWGNGSSYISKKVSSIENDDFFISIPHLKWSRIKDKHPFKESIYLKGLEDQEKGFKKIKKEHFLERNPRDYTLSDYIEEKLISIKIYLVIATLIYNQRETDHKYIKSLIRDIRYYDLSERRSFDISFRDQLILGVYDYYEFS